MRALAVPFLATALSCCATVRPHADCEFSPARCIEAMDRACPDGVASYVITSHLGNDLRPYHDPLGGMSWLDEPAEVRGRPYYHIAWDCKGAK